MRVRVPPPLLLLFCWTHAWAHEPGLSRVQISPSSVTLAIDRDEFADRFPTEDLEAARLILLEHTLAQTSIRVNGRPCDMRKPTVSSLEEDGIALAARLACPDGDNWVYSASWLRGREDGHQHRVEVQGTAVEVLGPQRTEAEFSMDALPIYQVMLDYIWLGGLHILSGFDHLALVFGLLVVVRTWREAFWLVTGFTIAHSVTLSAAVLGLFPVSPALVEPLIALTVVGIGVENLTHPPTRRRLLWTVLIGLIHGLGFASMLVALGLPAQDTAIALVSFNVGVEIGQLAVVAIALPVVLYVARTEVRRTRLIQFSSAVLCVFGALWFLERVFT